MVYSSFAIEQLKSRLMEKSMRDSTPKKFANDMFEAAEVIIQLQHKEAPMLITNIHVDEYYCPACGSENNADQGAVSDTYCPNCGQRLEVQTDEV